MLKTVEGIYRNGKVELLEAPEGINEAPVIVTFLPKRLPLDLRARGIDEAQAADLRARLRPFAEDWERPEMEAYDVLYHGRFPSAKDPFPVRANSTTPGTAVTTAL